MFKKMLIVTFFILIKTYINNDILKIFKNVIGTILLL